MNDPLVAVIGDEQGTRTLGLAVGHRRKVCDVLAAFPVLDHHEHARLDVPEFKLILTGWQHCLTPADGVRQREFAPVKRGRLGHTGTKKRDQ
jgi:hypothetical protein